MEELTQQSPQLTGCSLTMMSLPLKGTPVISQKRRNTGSKLQPLTDQTRLRRNFIQTRCSKFLQRMQLLLHFKHSSMKNTQIPERILSLPFSQFTCLIRLCLTELWYTLLVIQKIQVVLIGLLQTRVDPTGCSLTAVILLFQTLLQLL